MNHYLMVFGLLCIGGAQITMGCLNGNGDSSSLEELKEECQECVEDESTDETWAEGSSWAEGSYEFDAGTFKNEKTFACLDKACSSNEECLKCLRGSETNTTVCGQTAIKVCTTSIKEVKSKAGSLSDKDYYSEQDKTTFYNSASYCITPDDEDKSTKCIVDRCNDDAKCFPCLQRVRMYCGAYGDEIDKCVKNKFRTNCVKVVRY